ncbi:heavy metal translocating P-type ATPase [Gloeomargarita lithophora Alchichica-D10]|uniref:Heavy metal translocating P-type ATPase n=1 Tax=Gloeomargarita lithophora Alchichica-D10 TaxID=1188229 RepID=A0A1J0AFY4_9CYAN|nr:heavy metal translocating P-type ATPase [Gloeomargarita lithophora]APB34854.1 heavy metal translocating P-type ATPase [Gloeomargarita lithophora Alchichica-D10]
MSLAVAPVPPVVYRVVHEVPGRLRVRVPLVGADPAYRECLLWLLERVPGVVGLRLSAWAYCVVVEGGERQAVFACIEEAGREYGVGALLAEQPEEDWGERFGWPLLALGLGAVTMGLQVPVPAWVMVGVVLWAARPVFVSSWHALSHERKLNLDVLDALWTVIHALEGQYVPPALQLSIGEATGVVRDATARQTSRRHSVLMDLATMQVRVERGGQEQLLSLVAVCQGDVVVLTYGDRIPVDGTVVRGEGFVDNQNLSGEVRLQPCQPGSTVYASGLVVRGQLWVRAEKTGQDTRMGRALTLLKEAPQYDSRVSDYAEQVGEWTITPVLFLSGILFTLTGNWHQALALLQLDFGTGVKLASATAILTAVRQAAQYGLYIRSGRALEMLAQIQAVAFDKTGTLTQGRAQVFDVYLTDVDSNTFALLELATALSKGSVHPASLAIVEYGEDFGIEPAQVATVEVLPGKGMQANWEGEVVRVGSGRWVRGEGVDTEVVSQMHPELKAAGYSLVYVAKGERLLGVVALTNPLRPEAEPAVQALQDMGLTAYVLTGDLLPAAQITANRLGIPPERVYAEVLPDQKVAVVAELEAEGQRLAYVGEGINDAPALAYASVSIALKGGSSLAADTADVVLTQDDLRSLVYGIQIARETMGVIYQNLGLVVVPNLSIVLGGVFFALDPVLAVMINSGAILLAELNSLRPSLPVVPVLPTTTDKPRAGHTTILFA